MEKVIIDTDPAIGVPFRDVDDGLAIALALNSPELEVLGLTLTYGNTSLRKAMGAARRILIAAGREDIPVYSGARSRKDLGKKTEAAEFIISLLGAGQGDVSLLTLGPLTNSATAERLHPGILHRPRRVVSMGGAIFGPGVMPPFFRSEFNFWKDPVASSEFVRAASGRLTLIPADLTMRVAFGHNYMKQLRLSRTGLSRRLYMDTLHWYLLNSMILFRDGFSPHDPVAVGWMTHPEMYETETVDISVKTSGLFRGETSKVVSGSRVQVAKEVDEKKFLEMMTDRLCS